MPRRRLVGRASSRAARVPRCAIAPHGCATLNRLSHPPRRFACLETLVSKQLHSHQSLALILILIGSNGSQSATGGLDEMKRRASSGGGSAANENQPPMKKVHT